MIAYYLILIAISLCLGIGGVGVFLWCLRYDQFEDLDGAAERIFFDEVAEGLANDPQSGDAMTVKHSTPIYHPKSEREPYHK